MYSYMVGKVVSINKKSITFENNYTGYVINVPNPELFEVNKVKKLYLYKHAAMGNKNNTIEELYGFDRYELKELFMTLITVSGIGPKTAINVCRNDPSLIKQLIAKRDVQSLSVLDGITPKYARLIIDNLCDTFKLEDDQSKGINVSELVKALKSLGYTSSEIEYALKNIKTDKAIELSDLISEAIKIIATGDDNVGIVKAN